MKNTKQILSTALCSSVIFFSLGLSCRQALAIGSADAINNEGGTADANMPLEAESLTTAGQDINVGGTSENLGNLPQNDIPAPTVPPNETSVKPSNSATTAQNDLTNKLKAFQEANSKVFSETKGITGVGIGFIDSSNNSVGLIILLDGSVPESVITAQLSAKLPELKAYPVKFEVSEPFKAFASEDTVLKQTGLPTQPDAIKANVAAGNQMFDAAGNSDASLAAPDGAQKWYDNTTGQWETEQTKLAKTYQLAMSNPLAAAVKNAIPYNTLYKVDRSNSFTIDYVARTTGDSFPADALENTGTDPNVIFTPQALRQLSPHYLAAKMASMWIRHLEKNVVPQSAEKTYMEGSMLIRVFMQLTGSTAQNWRGDLDYQKYDANDINNGANGQGFDIYRHFYSWIQGFEAQYQDVRQGPYFLNKIMGAQGSPVIYTDAAGRQTLFQRAQASQIANDAAAQAQQRFTGFVQNERN